jgi:hypothetical protein
MPSGIYQHKPLSEETKRKLSEIHKKIRHNGNFKKGNAPWNKDLKGIHLSPESEWKKGCNPPSPDTVFKKGSIRPNILSLKEYKALHSRINRKLGKPDQCTDCSGFFFGKHIHWANKSGEYKDDIKDWIALCVDCHSRYDKRGIYAG